MNASYSLGHAKQRKVRLDRLKALGEGQKKGVLTKPGPDRIGSD